LDGEDYLAFKSAIEAELLQQKSDLDVSFYELGASSEYGAKYSAIDLDFLTVLGAKVSAGNAFAFSESVKQGIAELKNYTEAVSASCPQTKFVVAGYSQGAMVITNGLGELNPNRFIYAATFGDPKLYLPEGRGSYPDACLGKSLSLYRIFAPNCHTYQGALDAKVPYLENGWYGKVGLWCKNQDLVCGAGFSFGTPKTEGNVLSNVVQSALHAHTRYPDDGIYELAARTIVEKIHQVYPDHFYENRIVADKQDAVIMINYSGMYGVTNYYRKIASALAEEITTRGGRVAFWTYDDTRKTTKDLDLTTNFKEFSAYLWSSGSWASGTKDHPNEFLSGVQEVLDATNWRTGSIKTLIVITRTPLKDPDLNGITGGMIKANALKNGAVSLYVISENEELGETYAELARSTGGDAFWNIDVSNTTIPDHDFRKSNLSFSLQNYHSKPNESPNFLVATADEITTYEWDLDCDGIFETTTSEPSASFTYQVETSGYIQAKATDSDGRTRLASAYIEINSSKPTAPSARDLKVTQKGSSLYLDYTLGENTLGLYVSLNDSPLGITNTGHLEITNITESGTISVKPVSTEGTYGNTISGEFTYSPPENSLPLAPQTGVK